MNKWQIDEGEIEKYQGFCYQIIEKDTGMSYVGKKNLWKTVKLKPLKGKKNKRHKKVETDWKKYTSSSPIMQEKIAKNPENYEFKLIELCETKQKLALLEAYIQMTYYFAGDWNQLYNEVIHLRMRIR